MLKGISFQILRAEYEKSFLCILQIIPRNLNTSVESCIVSGVVGL